MVCGKHIGRYQQYKGGFTAVQCALWDVEEACYWCCREWLQARTRHSPYGRWRGPVSQLTYRYGRYGLSDTVLHLAFSIVDKNQRKHPFKDGKDWFDRFRRSHPKLTIRIPQPVSYWRSLCSNKETSSASLKQFMAVLNLIAKPMQIIQLRWDWRYHALFTSQVK